jgi:hypothetical protein
VKPRLNYAKAAPGVSDARDVLDRYLQEYGLERPFLLLIHLRASQVEAVTSITDGRVPDTVHEQMRPHFSEKELADLTLAVATINAWNRLSISARLAPGGYQPTAAAS